KVSDTQGKILQEFDAPKSKQQTETATDGGQQEVLGQQLTDDSCPTCAYRSANRDFTLPSLSPGHQQICHVNTSDQQHESHGNHENHQCQPVVGDNLIPECCNHYSPSFVIRVLFRESTGDGFNFGLRVSKTDSSF